MRLAFIGGNGHHYLRGALEELRPEAAVAPDGVDAEPARALAARLPGAKWFDDAAVMLDTFKPEVVSVGAVYARNGVWATEALRRGIAVVSDKPVATSWEVLDQLRETAAKADVPLVTEFNFRSSGAFRAAHEAVKRGAIGKVVLATGQKSYRFGTRPAWYAHRELYGGTLPWVASHAIDAVVFASGRRLSAAAGSAGNCSKPDYGSMEDHTVSLFEFEGGGAAVVHADYLRPAKAPTHADDRLRLAGERGVIEVRDERCVLLSADEEPRDVTEWGGEPQAWRDLFDAAQGDTTWYGTQRSLGMAAILLAARDAADQRQRIELDPAWSVV
jgi:predicted dehydrogenase